MRQWRLFVGSADERGIATIRRVGLSIRRTFLLLRIYLLPSYKIIPEMLLSFGNLSYLCPRNIIANKQLKDNAYEKINYPFDGYDDAIDDAGTGQTPPCR